jgi:hypothetical protein
VIEAVLNEQRDRIAYGDASGSGITSAGSSDGDDVAA